MAVGEVVVNFETFLKENAFDKRELTIEDLKNNQCLDDDLLMLSDKLDNWEMTGMHLRLSQSELAAIRVDCPNEERRRARTLSKWKEKNGDDANYHSLIEALIKARRKDVACQALDYLKEEIIKKKDMQLEQEMQLKQEMQLEQEMKENFLKRIKSQILAKGLDVPDLQVNLRHEDIDEIIKLIGKDWYTFGLCMGVDESTLDSIKEVEGIDKLGRKRKLLEHLISIKSRYEDVIYGLYNSAEKYNPSIDGVLEYLFTIRIKQKPEAEPNSHIQNSGIQDQRSKPRENQLHDLHQNLTESNNAGPSLCKKQKKPQLPWQAVFDERRKNRPMSSQLAARRDLVPSKYREHFYGTLWLEEEEHIKKLEGKCDGVDYKLTIYDAQKIPHYLAQNRRYNSLQGYISGHNFTDDKIEYATQASDNVEIMRKDGSYICVAYKHHYNFDHLENHMYVVVPRSPKLLQAMKNGVKVKDGCEFKVRAQFIIKYSYFDHLHDAVIKVPEYVLEALLPISVSFRQLCLAFEPQYSDFHNFRYMKLDKKHQLKALKMIVSDSSPNSCPPPPVILYGPFGSGKTRILARAAYELMMNGIETNVCTRILISAHHEISITTFIFAYFGQVIAEGHRLPFKVILVSRKENKGKYADMYMTLEEFAKESDNIRRMDHIIVIATYTMSLNFYPYLYSSEGFFTHLFLDEAAQVREPEAIIPLTLATKNAKIVLAGDNKQVGPNILVLGEEARRFDLHVSLLERLMTRYEEIGAEATQYITRLSVNYRSDDSLINIPNLFYENLELNADKSLQKGSGPTGYKFVSADSKLVMEYADPDQPLVEACIVLEEVRSYLERMKQINPDKFNPRHDVCIITSTRKQLNNIKSMAYQYKEYEAVRKVSFKPSFMIQGHKFKAVFLSLFELVQRDELNASYTKSLFNPYVFNTAITRAKYYVVAIGMPKEVQQFEQETISDPGRGGNDTQCWHKYLALCKEQRTFIHHPDIPSAVLKRAKQTQASVPTQVPGLLAKNDTQKGKDQCKEELEETSEHTRPLALEETVKKLEKEKIELAELVKKLQKELEEEKSKHHGDVKTASKQLDGASAAMPKKEKNMGQTIVKAHMDDGEGMALTSLRSHEDKEIEK